MLSTKRLLLFVLQKKSVKFLKSYYIKQIDSVFLCDRILIIYYKVGNFIEYFQLTIGFFDDDKDVKNHEAEAQDLKKETELTFVKYALYFFILIWRIHFLLTHQTLKAVKVRNLEHVKLDKIYESYFIDIFQRILKNEVYDLNICTKVYEEKNGKKQEKNLNNKNTQSGRNGRQRHFINPFENKDTFGDLFFILYCTRMYESKLCEPKIEKNNKIIGYSRVIVKIQNNLVIVIEPLKDSITIFGINEIRNITINEGRFIILFHIIMAGTKQKLIFFTNTNYDEDYKNFKTFLVHLIENKR